MTSLPQYIRENETYLQKAVKVAWPAVVESFFVALVGLIDSFMVSRVGAYAVAAVGLTTQPKFIGLAVFIAINTSVSALVARRRGENRREDANRILLTAIACVLVLTVVVSVVCVVLADPIIHLVGSAEDTHEYAVAYFRIIMGGIGFSVLSLVINAAQRGSGNTRIAMTTNLASNLVNVIFNYLLIGGNFGFPALGVTGAAIATVIGTVVACGMSIASLFRKDSYVSIPYMLKQRLGLCRSSFASILNYAPNVFVE
ncbi:MAG: polysaccharide biosynthesis C-terminal domain-containing protein [Lachnospiraceae bacterium]|nr:polysaccharide biosynthesis C-terminal domain-containing protein [Lachnospiraceae bacterium]